MGRLKIYMYTYIYKLRPELVARLVNERFGTEMRRQGSVDLIRLA